MCTRLNLCDLLCVSTPVLTYSSASSFALHAVLRQRAAELNSTHSERLRKTLQHRLPVCSYSWPAWEGRHSKYVPSCGYSQHLFFLIWVKQIVGQSERRDVNALLNVFSQGVVGFASGYVSLTLPFFTLFVSPFPFCPICNDISIYCLVSCHVAFIAVKLHSPRLTTFKTPSFIVSLSYVCIGSLSYVSHVFPSIVFTSPVINDYMLLTFLSTHRAMPPVKTLHPHSMRSVVLYRDPLAMMRSFSS